MTTASRALSTALGAFGLARRREKAALVLAAERSVAAEATCRDHAMARYDEGEAVPRTERAGGSLRVRVARKGGELPVRDGLTVRHLPQDSRHADLEVGAPGEIDLDILEGNALAGEVTAHAVG